MVNTNHNPITTKWFNTVKGFNSRILRGKQIIAKHSLRTVNSSMCNIIRNCTFFYKLCKNYQTMKKIVFLTIVVALSVLTVSCKKDQSGNLSIGDVTYSACKSHTDKLAKAMPPYGDPDSATVTYDGGTLHVTHYNVLVNCAFEETGIAVDLSQSGDTTTIYEHEKGDLLYRCTCATDCTYDITGVNPGHHVLVFKNWYPEAKVMEFEF